LWEKSRNLIRRIQVRNPKKSSLMHLEREMARVSDSLGGEAALRPSDYLLSFQILQVLSGEAEPLGIDLGVVLAQQRGTIYLNV